MPPRRNGYAAQYDLKTRAPLVIPGQAPLHTLYASKDARNTIARHPIRDPRYSESDEDLDYKGYDPDAPKRKKHYVYVQDLEEYRRLCNPAPTTGYDPNNQTNFFFGSSTQGSNASVASGSRSTATSERSFIAPGPHPRARSVSTMSTLTDISALSTSYQASMALQDLPRGAPNTRPHTPTMAEGGDHAAGPPAKRRNLNMYDAGSTRIPAWAKGKGVAGTNTPSRVVRKTVSGASVNNKAGEDKDLAKGLFLAKALAAFDRGHGELLLAEYNAKLADRQEMVASFERGLADLSLDRGRSDVSSDYARLAIERLMPEQRPRPMSTVSNHEQHEQGDIRGLYPRSNLGDNLSKDHRQDLRSGPPAGGDGSRYRERSRSAGGASNATLRQDSPVLRRSASPPAMDLVSYRSRSRPSIKGLSFPPPRQDPNVDFSYRRLATPSTALVLWDSDGDDDGPSNSDKTIAGDGTRDGRSHRSVSDGGASDNDDYIIDEDVDRSSPVPKFAIRRIQSEGTSLVGTSHSRRAF